MDLPTVIEGRDPKPEEVTEATILKLEYKRKVIGDCVLIWELKKMKNCGCR